MTNQAAASIELVSFLAGNAEPFYGELARWLADLGIPTAHRAELSAAARGRVVDAEGPVLAALCAGAWVRREAAGDLALVAAPVPAAGGHDGRAVFFADVVVRRSSAARAFHDLRDGVFVYNEVGSLSGVDAVLAHLRGLGEVRGFFRTAIASGDHEASIEMVRSGLADAASIDSVVLAAELRRRPALERDLRVLRRLGPFPGHPLVVSSRVPPATRARLATLLTTAHESDAGRAVLARGGLERFVTATPSDYESLRELLRAIEGVSLTRTPGRALRWTSAARAS